MIKMLSNIRIYRKLAVNLLFLIVIVVLNSCEDSTPRPPMLAELIPKQSTWLPLNNNVQTSDDLIVYLDISESMKGFVSDDSQSVFSKTLRTLREFGATQSLPLKVHLRKVGKDVGSPQPNAALVNAAYNKTIYLGSESNLSAAISEFNKNLQYSVISKQSISHATSDSLIVDPSMNNKVQKENSGISNISKPPRFHVLVTDGVQYALHKRTNDECASGADAFCVQQKVRSLLDQGWAGTVLGLRSEYCCEFFSENNQKWIKYDTKNLSVDEHRPFYLFIFSPEHTSLADFVVSLKANLRKTIEAKLIIRELPLTTPYITDSLSFECNKDFIEKSDRQNKRLSCTTATKKIKEPLLITLRLQEESTFIPVNFQLSLPVMWSEHVRDSYELQELKGLLDWSLEKTYPKNERDGYRYPEMNLDKVYPVGDDRFVFIARTSWPQAAGIAAWRGYRIVGRLKRDAEPGWISQWTTPRDTMPSAGNRTLDLRTTFLGLWRNPMIEKRAIAELYLRLGPK